MLMSQQLFLSADQMFWIADKDFVSFRIGLIFNPSHFFRAFVLGAFFVAIDSMCVQLKFAAGCNFFFRIARLAMYVTCSFFFTANQFPCHAEAFVRMLMF